MCRVGWRPRSAVADWMRGGHAGTTAHTRFRHCPSDHRERGGLPRQQASRRRGCKEHAGRAERAGAAAASAAAASARAPPVHHDAPAGGRSKAKRSWPAERSGRRRRRYHRIKAAAAAGRARRSPAPPARARRRRVARHPRLRRRPRHRSRAVYAKAPELKVLFNDETRSTSCETRNTKRPERVAHAMRAIRALACCEAVRVPSPDLREVETAVKELYGVDIATGRDELKLELKAVRNQPPAQRLADSAGRRRAARAAAAAVPSLVGAGAFARHRWGPVCAPAHRGLELPQFPALERVVVAGERGHVLRAARDAYVRWGSLLCGTANDFKCLNWHARPATRPVGICDNRPDARHATRRQTARNERASFYCDCEGDGAGRVALPRARDGGRVARAFAKRDGPLAERRDLVRGERVAPRAQHHVEAQVRREEGDVAERGTTPRPVQKTINSQSAARARSPRRRAVGLRAEPQRAAPDVAARGAPAQRSDALKRGAIAFLRAARRERRDGRRTSTSISVSPWPRATAAARSQRVGGAVAW